MSEENNESLPEGALGKRREVTIEALMEHFADDGMEVEEFERRVEIAHKATTADELRALLADFPAGGLPVRGEEASPGSERRFRVTSAAHVKEREFMLSVLGGASRKGRWEAARTNLVGCLMGGAEMDFREAVLGPGVTEVRAFVIMGGIDIIVPPEVRVEVNGFALMGGFDHAEDTPGDVDDDAPVIRITGAVIMGGVALSVRHAGESAREARKRRKLDRKEQRRLEKGR